MNPADRNNDETDVSTDDVERADLDPTEGDATEVIDLTTESTGEEADDANVVAGPRKRRTRVLALGLAVLLALGGVGTAILMAHKSVQIDVDGETQNVSSFAGDIGNLLEERGITVGEHDLLQPGADEPLTDGAEIVIRSAEQIQVTLDGEAVQVWTVGDTAAEALADIVASGRDASITASRTSGRHALELPLVANGSVVFEVDGDSRTLDIDGVADLSTALLRAELEIDENDRVEVTTRADGTPVVTITRIASEQDSRTESIDFETVERGTDDLYEGEERVVAEGAEGERTFTYVSYLVDGEVASQRLVSAKVTTKPQDRVIEYGTAVRPAPEPEPAPVAASGDSSGSSTESSDSGSSDSGSSDSDSSDSGSSGGGTVSGDVWAALAQCESGGNPTTNTGNGYYGLYQFSLPTWQAVGGTGLPSEASAAEQTKRAQILQARSGWGQWPACSAKLGLR